MGLLVPFLEDLALLGDLNIRFDLLFDLLAFYPLDRWMIVSEMSIILHIYVAKFVVFVVFLSLNTDTNMLLCCADVATYSKRTSHPIVSILKFITLDFL